MAGILLFYFIFFFLFLGIVAIYSPLGGSCILLKIQLLYDNVCRVCLFGSCSFKTNFERHSFFFLVGMIFVAGWCRMSARIENFAIQLLHQSSVFWIAHKLNSTDGRAIHRHPVSASLFCTTCEFQLLEVTISGLLATSCWTPAPQCELLERVGPLATAPRCGVQWAGRFCRRLAGYGPWQMSWRRREVWINWCICSGWGEGPNPLRRPSLYTLERRRVPFYEYLGARLGWSRGIPHQSSWRTTCKMSYHFKIKDIENDSDAFSLKNK